MVTRSNRDHFPNLVLSLPVLALVLTLAFLLPVTGTAAQVQVRRKLNGNVTFHCPHHKQQTLWFFYLQKGNEFVNGYHASNAIMNAMNHTTVNHSQRAVTIQRLSISDSGQYTCHIQYKDNPTVHTTAVIHLSVTATYSKPTLSVSCITTSCQVTCTSGGGYPNSKVTWNVPVNVTAGSQWKLIMSSKEEDSDTMLFNISSSADFNCSHTMTQSLSCTVGGVTSEIIEICKQPVSVYALPAYVIGAICAVGLICLLLVLLLFWKCRKARKKGAAVAVTPQEIIVLNGQEVEVAS
ncbi:hypothetical protein LDENG_00118160 [Lucifuga dentata]|nr:hypothetical protein LDENG_00118160 [Lucifuga dentata]